MSFAFHLYMGALLFLSCTKTGDTQPGPSPVADPAVTLPMGKRYLALGDSYTIGQSVPVTDRFPVQLVSMLRSAGFEMAAPEIIATTGWTTGNLLDAVKILGDAKNYDAVSLLIGVNNQYQQRSLSEYRQEFTLLLTKSIQFAGNNPSKVVVISIPDYSVTPFAQNSDKQLIATQIDAFNKVNKEISELYKVNYVEVTAESRKAAADPSLVASDGLHFSGKEYKIWADLILPTFKVILK